MNKISIEMLEQKIAEGEEIIDTYFDSKGDHFISVKISYKSNFIRV